MLILTALVGIIKGRYCFFQESINDLLLRSCTYILYTYIIHVVNVIVLLLRLSVHLSEYYITTIIICLVHDCRCKKMNIRGMNLL